MPEVTVIQNRRESPDAFTLILSKPEGFRFTPGQFVHLQTEVEGRPLRRSYTIASAPHEEHIHITIRTQQHGKVSPVLARLTEGDGLLMFGPFGDFTLSEEPRSVFIAAGSGITPFISYLRDMTQNSTERETILLYSNKTQEDMLYHQELQSIQSDWFTYTATLTQEEWNKQNGRFGAEDLQGYVDEQTVFYLCGSNSFVRAFTAHLKELGAAPDTIRTENYGNVHA